MLGDIQRENPIGGFQPMATLLYQVQSAYSSQLSMYSTVDIIGALRLLSKYFLDSLH